MIYLYWPVFCRVTDPSRPAFNEPATSVWRRYSDFELLRNYLEVMYTYVVIPPLPEKRVSTTVQVIVFSANYMYQTFITVSYLYFRPLPLKCNGKCTILVSVVGAIFPKPFWCTHCIDDNKYITSLKVFWDINLIAHPHCFCYHVY